MVYDSVFNVLLSCRQSLIDDLRTIRCFFFLLLSATFISYHRFKYLSTTFLFIFVVKLSLSNNSYMIPCIFSVVNNFLNIFSTFSVERREWDSNPCALADKRFSRPPRYDHFDISPYTLFSVRHVSVRRKMYSIIKSF